MGGVMTEKLYGLDDIPEGWELCSYLTYFREGGYNLCIVNKDFTRVWGEAKTRSLALHRAIQKARGEM